MAGSVTTAQALLLCMFCRKEGKPVQWKCKDCKRYMCEGCKVGVHPHFKNAENHRIVDVREFGCDDEQEETVDFADLKCEEHIGQSCVMYCRSCDQLVCPLCIRKNHNGHRLVGCDKGYRIKLRKFKRTENKIKEKIQELFLTETEIDALKTTEHEKYELAQQNILNKEEALQQEVHKYSSNLRDKLSNDWTHLNTFTENHLRRVGEIKQKLSDLADTGNVANVFVKTEVLENLLTEAGDAMKYQPKSMTLLVPNGELGITQHNIGTLYNIEVVEQFTTDISSVKYMAICSDDSLWIGDNNNIKSKNQEK